MITLITKKKMISRELSDVRGMIMAPQLVIVFGKFFLKNSALLLFFSGMSKSSSIGSSNNLIGINDNNNNIELLRKLDGVKFPKFKVDSGTQLTERRAVGVALTGTGITGLVGAGIAGTLVAVKVGVTGVVAALAGWLV